MQRVETCTVQAKKKGRYYVKITKKSECGGCKACGFGRKNYVILPALSNVECNVGDTVNVSMPTKSVKASYIYLYLLPLLFMFIGIAAAYGHGEKIMLLCGAIGLAVSFGVIYLIERLVRRKKQYMPVIIGVISPQIGEKND